MTAGATTGAATGAMAGGQGATGGSRKSYRRLLLKLSGEALMGKGGYGIDVDVVDRLARDVAEAANVASQAVEEFADIAGLGTQTGASCVDDRGIEPETLRDVDSGGGAGHSNFQFVGGLQRGLVESYRCIYNARSICAEHFQRSVVRGNDGDSGPRPR